MGTAHCGAPFSFACANIRSVAIHRRVPLMIKNSVLVAFIGLIVGPLSAWGSEPPSAAKTVYHFDDPVKWATPEAIVPPEYPPHLLAKGVTATVDVVFDLKPTGRLDSVVRITSEPKVDAFEQAVLEVLI